MNTKFSTAMVILTVLSTPASFASRWDGNDSPEKMSRGRYSFKLSDVPEKARLSNERIPWSDTYWPTYKGGIAYRWQYGKPGSTWSYKLYSRDQLKKMRPEEIAKLSPAEKYDIWQADYSYPTVRRERGRTNPGAAHWAGLCHGWVPAANNHSEPTPKIVTNADGIEISFGSSDIKALLIFYYGKVNWKPIGWTGRKCKGGILGGACNGVNAGAVHVALTNQIARLNEGFVMDRDRGHEIWNQPFFAYSFTKTGSCNPSGSARKAGATHGAMIKMDAMYVDELTKSQWDPHLKSDPSGVTLTNEKKAVYRYCLELTADDRIVGGEWYSKIRPGYIWNHKRTDFAHPYWGRMRQLTNDTWSPEPAPAPAILSEAADGEGVFLEDETIEYATPESNSDAGTDVDLTASEL